MKMKEITYAESKALGLDVHDFPEPPRWLVWWWKAKAGAVWAYREPWDQNVHNAVGVAAYVLFFAIMAIFWGS